ncbi:TetR/AcrR family transcriptional regulator [Frankia sp. Mgl5]|uniref:TetR/AcrR family transcriptional regulator n=1 Tax=Frankia sp. Mgl5 TaxID=2933793 RepID=UPI00200C661F|nr:TetR/AcrR family transcriptional regulator [Frankia sp. Mgl5]MCK9931599.1 TetR/AcrR family transcriptional regulator [Frankia sp. Mgl5]
MPDRTLAPPRGTRPRNRRALILGAASDLFARRGYDQIGMTDLAEAVAIGPSALYRHFSSKQNLLREVIAGGLAPMRQLLENLNLADPSTASAQLAALCLDERHLGVLWQREARRLTPNDHALVRAEVREIGRRLTDRVRAARPELDRRTADLVTWATLAVLMSPSFHHLELPRPAYDELLAELAGLVLETPLPSAFAAPSPPPAGPVLLPASRREALLAQAVRMFAAQGFASVGIEDIGNAVGITGPSVYNHFPSKLDMLRTAFQRGTAALLMDVSTIYQTSSGAADALRRLVVSYIRFSQVHHDLIGLLITEVEHLPEVERHAARRAQHNYLTEWVHLLQLMHPELEPTTARIRVHSAVAVANDTARTPHLRHNPDVPAAIESICGRLLGLGL